MKTNNVTRHASIKVHHGASDARRARRSHADKPVVVSLVARVIMIAIIAAILSPVLSVL